MTLAPEITCRTQPGAWAKRYWVTRAGFEPAISTLRGWRPGPLDERAWACFGGLRKWSGVYAIGFADHEAHGAGRLGDAAYLVVDDARGRAACDQLGLVDVAGLTAFGRQQPDAAGLIDPGAP